MKIRLSQNTYIRTASSRGYIANTCSGKQLVYDDIGASWLRVLSKESISLENIMLVLKKEEVFNQVSDDVLKSDLIEFYKQLFDFGFVQIDNFSNEMGIDNMTQEINLPNALKTIFFEITDKCNEKCIHCYIPQSKKACGINLPLERFKKTIDEFCSIGGKEVALSGGEIAMHPNFFLMLDYCAGKNLDICLFSNCISLDESAIKLIHKAGVSVVQVSLYSLYCDIHDSITKVRGSCQKTLNAIKDLHKCGIDIRIAIPAMKENAKSIVDILKFAKINHYDAKVDFAIIAKEDLTLNNLYHRLSLEETEHLLREIHSFDKEYLLRYRRKSICDDSDTFDFLKYLNKNVCGVGVDNICIAANGDAIPCAGWNGMVLGNINEQSLSEIWRNSVELSKLRLITEKDFSSCVNCDANNYCMRCMNRNYNECNTDKFCTPQHFCDVAHLLKRIIENN